LTLEQIPIDFILDLGSDVRLVIKTEKVIVELFVERIEKLLWVGGGLLTYSTKAVYI